MSSSSWLVGNFGVLQVALKPKKATLGNAYIEMEVMLELNKHLCPSKVHRPPRKHFFLMMNANEDITTSTFSISLEDAAEFDWRAVLQHQRLKNEKLVLSDSDK